jgi:hypothetical protein
VELDLDLQPYRAGSILRLKIIPHPAKPGKQAVLVEVLFVNDGESQEDKELILVSFVANSERMLR